MPHRLKPSPDPTPGSLYAMQATCPSSTRRSENWDGSSSIPWAIVLQGYCRIWIYGLSDGIACPGSTPMCCPSLGAGAVTIVFLKWPSGVPGWSIPSVQSPLHLWLFTWGHSPFTTPAPWWRRVLFNLPRSLPGWSTCDARILVDQMDAQEVKAQAQLTYTRWMGYKEKEGLSRMSLVSLASSIKFKLSSTERPKPRLSVNQRFVSSIILPYTTLSSTYNVLQNASCSRSPGWLDPLGRWCFSEELRPHLPPWLHRCRE
jgi:hypothetical protein